MPTVVASAPGKVTLFGEHAVVYGYPAIVAAISKRLHTKVTPRRDHVIQVVAKDIKVPGIVLTYFSEEEVIVETDYKTSMSALSYVRTAVDVVREYLGINKGAAIEVTSEMPVGAGLGTSAAVSVTTIAGYAAAHGYALRKEEIRDLAWEVEKRVQGRASPMDTSIATFGGVLKIVPGEGEPRIEALDAPEDLPFVIGYVEREAGTKEMVARVARLRERFPNIIEEVMSLIGRVTEEAEKALKNGDLVTLGTLMNINNGLLDALGVSNKRLNELVYAARWAGALGSKLTGAGGGGAVIALSPGREEQVEVAMKLHGALTLRADVGVVGLVVRKVRE